MNHHRRKNAVHFEKMSTERIALLLAGGEGKRLQELTREIFGTPIPKQYCRLYNDSSLLESTLKRTILYVPSDKIHVIINRDHLAFAADQVDNLPAPNVFVQPANCDTGPGLIFSLLQLKRLHSDPIVAVFPTDHYIDNDQAFMAHVLRATQLITYMPEKIAILGITPDRPETGYGYLLPDSPVRSCEKTYHVKSFSEKPNLSGAYEIITLGGLWNTFVMIFKLSRMIDILKRTVPAEFHAFSGLIRSPQKATEIYRTIDPWNFSTRVLTRIPQHIIMLEIDNVHWSDWGTRESIERTYQNLNRVPFWKQPPPRPIQPQRESSDRTSSSQFIA